MKYEYKFVEVPLRGNGFKTKQGDSFEICKDVITEEANNGWRLKEIFIPPNEKTGISVPYNYQVIFERSI